MHWTAGHLLPEVGTHGVWQHIGCMAVSLAQPKLLLLLFVAPLVSISSPSSSCHTYLTLFTFIHGCLLVPQAVILSQIFLDKILTAALGCEHCCHYWTPFLLKLSASAWLHWIHDHLVLQCPQHTGLCHPHNISSHPCSQHLRWQAPSPVHHPHPQGCHWHPSPMPYFQ